MSNRTAEMGKMYNELRDQGTSGKEAVRMVNDKFGTTAPVGTISKYASMLRNKELGSPSDQGEHTERGRPKVKTQKVRPTLASLAERIKAIEEILQKMQSRAQPITDTQDMPPEPQVIKGEGKGRREDRDYQKVSVTIDRVLWEKFCQERDRMRVSAGRLMDIVLWNRYGRPRLSFQQPEQN